jgi:hypothetical protein
MYASLLTLDQSTLFYRSLSEASTGHKRKRSDEIKEWNSAVPKSKPISGLQAANSVTSSHARPRSATPSLSGAGRSSAPSVLTDNVKVISQRGTSESTKVNPELASTTGLDETGYLSSSGELSGEEREVAFSSPIKGKKRVMSEVRKVCLSNTMI